MQTTLNERYALAWLEISTISILTVIGSLFYIISNITTFMTGSRSRLETVCDSINATSAQIYNAPSILLNATMVSMVTAKENIQRNLSTVVSVIESCVIWLVQMYKSTYRCLLGLAVHSVLSVVTQITGPLQKAAQGITSFVSGGDYMSGDWTRSLTDTQSKVDDWFKNDDDVIQKLIDKPFQLLHAQINDTLAGWEPPKYSSAPQLQEAQEQVCSSQDLIVSLDHVEFELKKYVYIFIGLLFGIMFFCILSNMFVIRSRHHRVTQARAMIVRLLRTTPTTPQECEKMLQAYTSADTFISWHEKSHPVYRLLHFMSHPIALYCLVVGIVGVITTFSLVWVLEMKSQQLYQDFTNQAQTWSMDASSQWTHTAALQYNNINYWINETEFDLNNQAFGVIKSTAITINETLTNVVDQVRELVVTVLGGTLLEAPAKDLIQCLLLTKIENIEQGLTWIVSKIKTSV
ncbi:hypothetical protein INT47_002357 [Mucor saturninus]|uniref:Plasma membrane fusion protein PRM1 n=1 Tax=Mucor saturninus TaxID=64648 RepID=A0A8H7QSV6_9FUNG|nr:hypothetical protein INT47_002357 [Mucor saturninus]